jgi:hypothetical protein
VGLQNPLVNRLPTGPIAFAGGPIRRVQVTQVPGFQILKSNDAAIGQSKFSGIGDQYADQFVFSGGRFDAQGGGPAEIFGEKIGNQKGHGAFAAHPGQKVHRTDDIGAGVLGLGR